MESKKLVHLLELYPGQWQKYPFKEVGEELIRNIGANRVKVVNRKQLKALQGTELLLTMSLQRGQMHLLSFDVPWIKLAMSHLGLRWLSVAPASFNLGVVKQLIYRGRQQFLGVDIPINKVRLVSEILKWYGGESRNNLLWQDSE